MSSQILKSCVLVRTAGQIHEIRFCFAAGAWLMKRKQPCSASQQNDAANATVCFAKVLELNRCCFRASCISCTGWRKHNKSQSDGPSKGCAQVCKYNKTFILCKLPSVVESHTDLTKVSWNPSEAELITVFHKLTLLGILQTLHYLPGNPDKRCPSDHRRFYNFIPAKIGRPQSTGPSKQKTMLRSTVML